MYIAFNPNIYWSKYCRGETRNEWYLMVCNLLDIGCKIGIWVYKHDVFLYSLDIEMCLDQHDYHSIIHHILAFFRYVCISPLCTKPSLFSINCKIDVKDILQIQPNSTHEREDLYTILPYWLQTSLQHSIIIEYLHNACVLSVDIPHTEIFIALLFMTNCVWTYSTLPLLWRSQTYPVQQSPNAAPTLCYMVTV